MEDSTISNRQDRTSLRHFQAKKVNDLVISADNAEWSPKFLHALQQQRLFEYRQRTLVPPRKVPFKFHYCFECDDPRCKANHKMMIEDWEVGAFFWRMVDSGSTPGEAAQKVREKFLDDLCGPD